MEYFIRPVQLEDIYDINKMRTMRGVFENIYGFPSERIEISKKFIENLDSNSHVFVAVTKINDVEKVIGHIGLLVSNKPRTRHSATFGIMVHKDYQNCGVGSKLLESIIDMADNWLMLSRIELCALADNEKAINLYKKFGFVHEGLKIKSIIRNGKYENEVVMARIK